MPHCAITPSMKKFGFFFYFLLWPGLAVGSPDFQCVNNSRYLLDGRILVPIIGLSRADFIHVVREYIYEGKFVYSKHAQKRMRERVITEDYVEYALRHPIRVENRVGNDHPSNPNEYTIIGLAKDRNRLRIGVSFEPQEGGRFTVVTVMRP